jgi:hypothetical protein
LQAKIELQQQQQQQYYAFNLFVVEQSKPSATENILGVDNLAISHDIR